MAKATWQFISFPKRGKAFFFKSREKFSDFSLAKQPFFEEKFEINISDFTSDEDTFTYHQYSSLQECLDGFNSCLHNDVVKITQENLCTTRGCINGKCKYYLSVDGMSAKEFITFPAYTVFYNDAVKGPCNGIIFQTEGTAPISRCSKAFNYHSLHKSDFSCLGVANSLCEVKKILCDESFLTARSSKIYPVIEMSPTKNTKKWFLSTAADRKKKIEISTVQPIAPPVPINNRKDVTTCYGCACTLTSHDVHFQGSIDNVVFNNPVILDNPLAPLYLIPWRGICLRCLHVYNSDNEAHKSNGMALNTLQFIENLNSSLKSFRKEVTDQRAQLSLKEEELTHLKSLPCGLMCLKCQIPAPYNQANMDNGSYLCPSCQ